MTYRVTPMSSGEFDVQVEAAHGVRSHRVVVGPELLRAVRAEAGDGRAVVSAAIDCLEEREELASLPAYVDLSAYRSRAGFVRDVRSRLAS